MGSSNNRGGKRLFYLTLNDTQVLLTAVGTVVENALVYPFWVMKTRQHADTGKFRAFDPQLFRDTMRLGIRRLYKGFFVYSIASLPSYVIYVTSYTWSKSAMGYSYSHENANMDAAMAPLAAGIFADAASLGLYVPVDVLVQRLQLPGRHKSVRHAILDMWKDGGLRTFYRGFGATVVTSAVASGVWWMSYENLKQLFHSWVGERNSDSIEVKKSMVQESLPHVMAGFCAGGLAGMASNPFDIVKTRLQVG